MHGSQAAMHVDRGRLGCFPLLNNNVIETFFL
jgi:hypothetical protein